jgi:5-methylcytosine-specific restriction endonuclease McrA
MGQEIAPNNMPEQGLLFGDDADAQARRIRAEERKRAWDSGNPFPEDHAKWCAAHRDLINAASRQSYYEFPEWALHRTNRRRAISLGCQIGRRNPILRIYQKAAQEASIPCYWCKRLVGRNSRQVDHLKALAAGGSHTAGNLRIVCNDCNLTKGDMDQNAFRILTAQKRLANTQETAAYFRRTLAT